MTEYTYESNFAEKIVGLIQLQKSIGYKYEPQEMVLRQFDRFCKQNYPNEISLTKELVLHWTTRTCTESVRNLKRRTAPIRSLAKYINARGGNAYLYPTRTQPRSNAYIPHIFTDIELTNIFSAIDRSKYCAVAPLRHLIMPTIFRVIYCCGLRISEATSLKTENVDLNTGVLTIVNTKYNKDRLVPMNNELTAICREYSAKAHIFDDAQIYFFPNRNGGQTSQSSIYKFFREILWEAGISHGGRGYGPRIHDFRHTFAVNCLRKWILEGKDLNAYLPYLKTYLGHYSFLDTAYYLRLTSDVYPELLKQIEDNCGGIIPLLGGELNA